MSWNWQRILKGNKNLPEFNKPVLLYEEKDNKKYATVGMLKSIDGNGCHWNNNTTNNIFDMFNMFDEMKTNSKDKFNPTHWCEIETPNK